MCFLRLPLLKQISPVQKNTVACHFTMAGLETTTIQKKHMSYVTRYLLDSLLNHQFDDAVQCMVALCGACAKTPEMFWRVIL